MRLRSLQIRYEDSSSWSAGREVCRLCFPRVVDRPEWQPRADLYQTPSEWILKVELPGLGEEDFEVVLYEDGVLVHGRRHWHVPEGHTHVHVAEIQHGPFQLAVRLPEAVDRESARARYEQGFLQVVVPRLVERA